MLETSRDLLLIVVAFCVLWFTVFVCWMIYWLAMIFKQIHGIVSEFRKKIDQIGEVLETVKEKVEHSISYLDYITEGARYVIGFLKKRGEEKVEEPRKPRPFSEKSGTRSEEEEKEPQKEKDSSKKTHRVKVEIEKE